MAIVGGPIDPSPAERGRRVGEWFRGEVEEELGKLGLLETIGADGEVVDVDLPASLFYELERRVANEIRAAVAKGPR